MKNVIDLKEKKILVTGASGFLGSQLVEKLRQQGAKNLFLPTHKEVDLINPRMCKKVVEGMDIVIHLSAKVGGIGYNNAHPAQMFYENLVMGVNLFHEAWKAKVEKFVAIGTVCCYPKYTPIPFREENLWNGYPEETNAPYGLAKKMLLVQAQAYRQQYGFNGIFLLPVNLYGPGDNFDPRSYHVIPALIRKFIEAKKQNQPYVIVWGTGKATREFLYVKDAAQAIVLATEKYNKSDPINIGASFEISIRDLANLIRKLTRYKGKIVFDKSKPDGQPRRKLDTTKAFKEFGFKSQTPFEQGLRQTIELLM